MAFDGIVFGAYVSGGMLIFVAVLFRYAFGTDRSGKIMRLINAIKIVGPFKKTPDAFGMLIQYTGILSCLLGTAFGIILKRLTIEGVQEDILIFFVLFGPPTLLIGVTAFLRRFYWQRQK